MKYLVTGASGFLGRNFIQSLSNDIEVLHVDSLTNSSKIEEYCSKADFVFHFAAVQKAEDYESFYKGNVKLTQDIINFLTDSKNLCPILFSSSIHLDKNVNTDFAKTKKIAEDLLIENHNQTGRRVGIFRLTHTFGPHQKPNHNSVVSTFCHNVVNQLPISISNLNCQLNLMFISSVITEFMKFVNRNEFFVFKSFLGEGHSISVLELLCEINKLYLFYSEGNKVEYSDDSFHEELLQTIKFYCD
ncbi:NAD-dependent epimerase/dehydratase family protein [Shewanella chilikensis]|uniref:NAD-dependent epimerase/dehydratase family protein n=1 Tax=Shewanella chilikensis TaxID=558541 RepID=UPI00399BB7EE